MYFEQLWVTYLTPLMYIHCMQQFHYTVKSSVMSIRPCPISSACSAVNVSHIMHDKYINTLRVSGYVQAQENIINKTCVHTENN